MKKEKLTFKNITISLCILSGVGFGIYGCYLFLAPNSPTEAPEAPKKITIEMDTSDIYLYAGSQISNVYIRLINNFFSLINLRVSVSNPHIFEHKSLNLKLFYQFRKNVLECS